MLIDQSIRYFGTLLHFVRHYGIRRNEIRYSGTNSHARPPPLLDCLELEAKLLLNFNQMQQLILLTKNRQRFQL